MTPFAVHEGLVIDGDEVESISTFNASSELRDLYIRFKSGRCIQIYEGALQVGADGGEAKRTIQRFYETMLIER